MPETKAERMPVSCLVVVGLVVACFWWISSDLPGEEVAVVPIIAVFLWIVVLGADKRK